MSLKHGLLGLLNYGAMTGYELSKAFKDSLSFFWQAQTSQIYRELGAMEQKGWLRSERVVQSEKPNKRVYSLTADGREALDQWLSAPGDDIEAAMHIQSAFVMRVFFAGEREPAQTLAMLRAYQGACRAHLAHLSGAEDIAAHYGALVGDEQRTKYWELAVLYGDMAYRAGLAWAEKAIAMLEGAEA